MSYFELDTRQCDEIIKAIENFADGSEAESIINEYLAEEGGDLLKQSIHDLLPVSGRTWKGKKRAAKSTDPFKKNRWESISQNQYNRSISLSVFPGRWIEYRTASWRSAIYVRRSNE